MVCRALIMGVPVTRYQPGGRQFPALTTASEDVNNMRRLLQGGGFSDSAIDVRPPDLSAEDAMSDMIRLVAATREGDLSVMYFSGHGWSFPDPGPAPDEANDECLVFADKPIVDDWARSRLWPKARAGARVVVMLDACHSATAILGLGDDKAAPPARASDTPWWRLVLSACGDEETTLAADDTGGAITYEVTEALRTVPRMTYRELWPVVAQGVLERFHAHGIGRPVQNYSGPDDSLLALPALTAL